MRNIKLDKIICKKCNQIGEWTWPFNAVKFKNKNKINYELSLFTKCKKCNYWLDLLKME